MSQCTEVQSEICRNILLFLQRKNDNERKWLFFTYVFFSKAKSFFKDVKRVWKSKWNTIWMKALQNWNWRLMTDSRLQIILVPFSLSLSLPLFFPLSFFVSLPPSLSFPSFLPSSFPPFDFLVHFVLNKTNKAKPNPKINK